jgi:hypothetical protein
LYGSRLPAYWSGEGVEEEIDTPVAGKEIRPRVKLAMGREDAKRE